MRQKQIIGLDVMRFSAALLVVFYHLGVLYLTPAHGPYLNALMDVSAIRATTEHVAHFGWIGVQIFFVISGVVIASSVEGKTASSYVRARFLRLYPGVWVCTAISMACIIFTQQAPASTWLSLWLRSSLIFPIGPWVDGAYWTLPVEITFYALMLTCIGRSRQSMLWVGTGLIAMSAVFWAAFAGAPSGSWLGRLTEKIAVGTRFDLAFIQYGVYFGIGIFISRWRSTRATLLLAAVLPLCYVQIAKVADRASSYAGIDIGHATPFGIWLVAVLAIIASIRYNDWVHARLAASSIAVIRRIGLATYPLYLVHVAVGFAVMHVCHHAGLGPWPAWLAGLVVPVAAAYWIANRLEPQVRLATGKALDLLPRRYGAVRAG